jgi:hypothetical protein
MGQNFNFEQNISKMERAVRLKIYQFVVLMGTTNWKIYRDTAHCRKKIFFFKLKN